MPVIVALSTFDFEGSLPACGVEEDCRVGRSRKIQADLGYISRGGIDARMVLWFSFGLYTVALAATSRRWESDLQMIYVTYWIGSEAGDYKLGCISSRPQLNPERT